MTGGYARGGARSVQRGVALLAESDQAGLIISDEWNHTRAATVQWYLHTAANVTLGVDGASATLTLGGQTLALRVMAPTKGISLQAAAAGLPFPDVDTFVYLDGRETAIHRVTVTIPASAGRVVVQLGGASENGASTPSRCVRPLSQWADAAIPSIFC